MRTTLVKFSSAANDPARYSHKYDDTDEEAWRSFRYLGLFASFCALGFSAVALSSGSWVVGRGYNVGLWDNYCQYNVTENDTVEIGCLEERTKGQSTVIGLLLFAVAFGLLGTILCTCGICVESIYMKMYYFHSAGEIYFVCTVASTSALVMYLTSIEFDPGQQHRHGYGAGFGLAWISDCLFGAAAVCMCLDDIVGSLRGRRRAARGHVTSSLASTSNSHHM